MLYYVRVFTDLENEREYTPVLVHTDDIYKHASYIAYKEFRARGYNPHYISACPFDVNEHGYEEDYEILT